MIYVTFDNKTYDCTRAVRSADSATLYLAPAEERPNGGTVEFIGVSDWTAFSIEGGEWEAAPPTETEQIRSQVASLEAAQQDTDEQVVDQAYRLALLEMGVN